ncbi:MAG: EscU/YscU/HrcU family type III secretion system export apparatus switch protein [Pirellula sp.]|nr:EscU/YscU/HrcU family type III secretion system export apparatus switch protein [Pirellula sp.]
MADDRSGDKKHEGTDHRRQKARDEGNVARSQDLSSAALLLVGIMLLDYTGPRMFQMMISFVTEELSSPLDWDSDARTAVLQFIKLLTKGGLAILPLMGGVLATSLIVHYAQVGVLWLPDKLGIDFSRINPIQGFQRLFSIVSVSRLGFGLVKIGLVAGVFLMGAWSRWDSILAMGSADIETVGQIVWTTMIGLCRNVAASLLVLSVIDYGFQRWKYNQDLMMTDEELREEMKMMQGDPQVKSRRRKVQRDLAAQRLHAEVPKADVIVTNPTELAIALRYDPLTMRAPIVVAKGASLVAAQIRKIALVHGIPILERNPLAQTLFHQVEIGQPIPATEYAAVAEVLKTVYQVQGRSITDLTKALT